MFHPGRRILSSPAPGQESVLAETLQGYAEFSKK